MKKWLTTVLLLITLTGTFYPCCLDDECNDEKAAGAKSENKTKQEGNCSPFFACATCPGFAETSKPFQIIQPAFENRVHHKTMVICNLTSYDSSFWQPPRSC